MMKILIKTKIGLFVESKKANNFLFSAKNDLT